MLAKMFSTVSTFVVMVSFVTFALMGISAHASEQSSDDTTADSQVCIPKDASITSAVFSIRPFNTTTQVINIHRITSSWDETSVTWSTFDESYDSYIENSFTADSTLEQTADIASLVESWINDTYPNYGILLAQDIVDSEYTAFKSSENTHVAARPKLDICYETTSESNCVSIQREDSDAEDVLDAYIWQPYPDFNGGSSSALYAGLISEGHKQSLIKFEIDVCPTQDSPGTATSRFWKRHPRAWPERYIEVGDVTYRKRRAIRIMRRRGRWDKTFKMFRSLASAKLNVLNGNESSCIASTIDSADLWLSDYGLNSGVRGRSDAWAAGKPLHKLLMQYNKGLLCAPSR